MGQPREAMDSLTRAVVAGDRSAIRAHYAEDAVADSPDAGRIVGRDAVADYLVAFHRAFPDMSFEVTTALETGDTAVDEGYLLGTNTGPLGTSEGELPATGRSVRMRECDVLTVRDGLAVSHRFYFDQLDLMEQLGLGAQQTVELPEQAARAQTSVRVGD